MAEAVAVVLAVARVTDDLLGEQVDVVAVHAGVDSCDALLHHAVAGNGVRVGGVGAGCDDGAEGQVVCAVIEHKGLELGAELLLREAGTDELAHMGECGVGDGLRVAHELDLLGVLDGAHELEIAVHEREARANRAILKTALDTAEEVDVHVFLDGDYAALGGAGLLSNPAGHVDLVQIELPGATGGHVLLEGVEVARVGVQEALVGRDDRQSISSISSFQGLPAGMFSSKELK